jgi:hypothetical protein
MDIKDQVESLARQIEDIRALVEDIHQAVAPAPRYRGELWEVDRITDGAEYERGYKAWRATSNNNK